MADRATSDIGGKGAAAARLMIALSGRLPGITYDLKLAAQEAEFRMMEWRRRRPRWQPARGDQAATLRLSNGASRGLPETDNELFVPIKLWDQRKRISTVLKLARRVTLR